MIQVYVVLFMMIVEKIFSRALKGPCKDKGGHTHSEIMVGY